MAIAFRKQLDNDTEFALWKIEEEADELYKKLQLNEEEKAFVEQLGHGKRHLHWLGTRVLLRKMLATDEYIDCKVDAHGKPYLVNLPYHISLSHSFDYAAVMISRNGAVGIDIEQISNKIERIAPRFTQADELERIKEPHKIEKLYACWCAKEAVYKCYGQKSVSFMHNLFTAPFDIAAEGTLNVSLRKKTVNLDYVVNYLQYEDYMIGYVKS